MMGTRPVITTKVYTYVRKEEQSGTSDVMAQLTIT
jgi:hypothetical protein